jgi:hypothetical protein
VLAGASTADAASTSSDKVILQPASTVTFKAAWDGLLANLGDGHPAHATILISATARDTLTLSGYYANGERIRPLHHTFGRPSGGTVPVNVTFTTRDGKPATGWLVFRNGDGPPETIALTVQRVVGAPVLVKPVIGAVLFAVILLLSRDHSLRKKFAKVPGAQLTWDHSLAVVDAKWSYTQSWASNITAVGAVLGTVLASKDFLSDSLSGLSVGAFLGLMFGFGLTAVFAPLVFTSLFKDGHATYLGLMLSAGLTSGAAIGEIGTLSIMLHRGGVPQAVGMTAYFAAVGLMALYVWRSVDDLVGPPTPTPTPPAPDLSDLPTRRIGKTSAVL